MDAAVLVAVPVAIACVLSTQQRTAAETDVEVPKERQLVRDPSFQRGFRLLAPETGKRVVCDTLQWNRDDGEPVCAVQDCAPPACENPVQVEGRCCPVCPERQCVHEGQIYADGEVFEPEPCALCQCDGLV